MAKHRENNSMSGRRTHGAKPYDPNNSFVKKVTTKVSDLMPQRSWLRKWFNTTQDTEDDTLEVHDSTECTESKDNAQEPPPLKRPRIRLDMVHPPGTFSIHPRNSTYAGNNIKKTESSKQFLNNDTVEDSLEPAVAGPSGILPLVSSTPAISMNTRPISNQRSELNSLISTENNGAANGTDDNSESSESTSGCSSLIPQNNRQEGPPSLAYEPSFTRKKRYIDDKLNFTNHLQSSSLFLDNNARDTLSSRQPSFNASIMNNSLERNTSLASPFYSGNITYGGASASGLYRKGRNLFSSSTEPQLKVPKRATVQVKPSSSSSDASGMSQTAKRILEALEHYSSPISDAKKIPLKRKGDSPPSGRKRPREEAGMPTPRVGLRHLTRELNVPTVPDILKIKRRQRLQDTTLAARKIISASSGPPAISKEYHIRNSCNDEPVFHGKLKGKQKLNINDDDTVEPINLPTIALPISTLPRFDITLPQHKKSPNKSGGGDAFKFASPIKVTDSPKSNNSINHFTFSKPLNAEEELNSSSDSMATIKVDSNLSSLNSFSNSMPNFIYSGSSTTLKLKEKKDSDSELGKSVSNMAEIFGGSKTYDTGTAKSQEFDSMTIKNDNDAAQKLKTTTDTKINDTLMETNVWECNECLIKNYNSKEHCMTCRAPNPTLKTTSKALSTSAITTAESKTTNDCFGSQYKLSSDQWECDSCMVRNKQADMKCVSCSAPKTEKKTDTSDLLSKFKPAQGSWECPGCLIRNPSATSVCPCCTTAKPGSNDIEKTDILKKPKSKTSSTSSTWECPCCMVRSPSNVLSCPCCMASKPGSDVPKKSDGFGDKFKKPEGAWNCDSCLIQNKADATKCVACEALKPGTNDSNDSAISKNDSKLKFNCDMPASGQTFKFGLDNSDEKSKTVQPVVVSSNGFTVGNNTQTADAKKTFNFGLPKANDVGSPKPMFITFGATTTNAGKVSNLKSTEENKADSAEKKTDETKAPAPIFSFGVPKTVDQQKEKFVFGTSATTETVKADLHVETNKITFTKSESVDNPVKATFGSLTSSSAHNLTNADSSIGFQRKSVEASSTAPTEIKSTPSFTFGSSSLTSTTLASTTTTASTIIAATTQTPTTGSTAPFSFSEQTSKTAAPQSVSVLAFGSTMSAAPSGSSSTFSFGGIKSSETPTVTQEKPSTFGTSNPQVPSSSTSFGTTSSGPLFGTSETKPVLSFGSAEKKPLLFGSTESKGPMFSESASKTPVFGTPEKSTSAFANVNKNTATAFPPTSTPAFGSSNTPFGSPSVSAFGNTAPTNFGSSNVFSIANQQTDTSTAPTATPSLFTFGSSNSQSSTQSAAPIFNFSAGNAASSSTAQKPLFAFGTGSNTTPQTGNTFGSNGFNTPAPANPTPSSSFTFNAPKPEAPAFGQATTTPMFNAPQATSNLGQTNMPFQAPSTGFNFGSAPTPTPTPSTGFNFNGMSQTQPPATGGFNFNAPSSTPTVAFDPNTRPSFNFTGGNAPAAFNAAPQSGRKIKKAVRRMTSR